MQSEKGHKLLPELLHTTFMVSNTLIYIVLRPVLRLLTGACNLDREATSLTIREPIYVLQQAWFRHRQCSIKADPICKGLRLCVLPYMSSTRLLAYLAPCSFAQCFVMLESDAGVLQCHTRRSCRSTHAMRCSSCTATCAPTRRATATGSCCMHAACGPTRSPAG